MKIPLARPFTDDAELFEVKQTLESGWLTQGPKVDEFEAALSRYVGTPTVAVSSATTALHLAVRLAGLKAGDEVVVPSYSFVATANCLLYEKIRPIFCDIDPITFNIGVEQIERCITQNTKAILVVDQFGLPADIDAIANYCAQKKLTLIEDAACAFGGTVRGQQVGSFPHITVFSFHPRKSITTGEGGAITARDPQLIERAKLLRTHGLAKSGEYLELGYNYRLPDINAAIGIAQLKKFDKILQLRRTRAERYQSAGISWLEMPSDTKYSTHTYQSFATVVKKSSPLTRDSLIHYLAKNDVASRPGIPPIHAQAYLKEFSGSKLPVTMEVSENTLILPLYAQMTDQEQDYVIDLLRNVKA